jgi:hypothetical protein
MAQMMVFYLADFWLRVLKARYSLIGSGPDAGSEDLQAALREQASQERTSGRAQGDLATCGACRNLFLMLAFFAYPIPY